MCEETETWVMRILHRIYMPVLRWAVANRGIVLAGAVGLVVMTVVLGRLLGLEFLPKLEEGNLWIRATLPPTISLEEGNAYVNEMRKLIRSLSRGGVRGVAARPSRRRHRRRRLLQRRVLRAAEARRANGPARTTRTS